MRQTPELEQVGCAGALRHRTDKNLRRLHDPEFHFAATIRAPTAREAPGDWVGRTLLALVLHARLARSVPAHLDEFVARLPEAFNARGYIGEIHPEGTADENQIGGHNALLRGLAEHYLWRRDERSLAALRSVVRNLMLPTAPLYAHYPDRARKDLLDNQLVGLTVRQATGVWRGLSTDIGVVFFTLDGLTQAYQADPNPELRGLIETMIARYAQIDPVAISAQTHSTLSTLRGVLRWWGEVDSRPELLALVRDRYATYRRLAETEHHANYNWFGRPDWTEACAVIDAYLLATQLWAATGDADYLEEAHLVFFNGLQHAQRPNGGFGCDICTGARGEIHVAPHKYFEAPWCCSMRGAEGLVSAARFGWWTNGGDTIELPFYFGGSGRLRLVTGEIEIEQESSYPETGLVRLRVAQGGSHRPVNLRFFAPSWSPAAEFRVTLNGRPLPVRAEDRFAVVRTPLATGDVVEAAFPVRFARVPLQNPSRQPGHHRYTHGPLLLGVDARGATAPAELGAASDFTALGGARYRCTRTGRELAPLPPLVDLEEADARSRRMQVVFPGPAD